MKNLFFKIWVSLVAVIAMVVFGFLVRQETIGYVKFGKVSEYALGLAELPVVVKDLFETFFSQEALADEQRFDGISGFIGNPIKSGSGLLLSRYDGDRKSPIVELIDLSNFSTIRSWSFNPEVLFTKENLAKPMFADLERDNSISRFQMSHPFLSEDGSLLFQNGTPLIKIDSCSKLLWVNNQKYFHHSLERDGQGFFWVGGRSNVNSMPSKLGDQFESFDDDELIRVDANGKIVFEKSITQIFIENKMEKYLFGLGNSDHFDRDPIHLNDIQPLSRQEGSKVLLSLRSLGLFEYDYGKNLIIRSTLNGMSQQHDVDIFPGKGFSVFDNNVYRFSRGNEVQGSNKIVLIDEGLSETISNDFLDQINQILRSYEVRTVSGGIHEWDNDRSLLVEETNFGRIIYISADGKLAWQYVNRAKSGSVYLVSWSRLIDKHLLEKMKRLPRCS